jgi:hypothetical protein
MILRGLNQIHAYLDNIKREHFRAWGIRNGLGPIGPAPEWNAAGDADLEETGFQAPGAAGSYWEIPNR